MSNIEINKKHHKRLNNPFPSSPKSLPLGQGTLLLNSKTVPSHHIYDIGKDFQLNWTSKDGGYLSISHKSQPGRSLWSTNPGKAFVSAAVVETQVEESRGSFVINDKRVHLVCDHQTIENIRIIGSNLQALDQDLTSFHTGELEQKTKEKNQEDPVLLITGKLFCARKRKQLTILNSKTRSEFLEKRPFTSARYSMMFDQKNSNQVRFQIRLDKPNLKLQQTRCSTRAYKGFARKLKRQICWSSILLRKKGSLVVSPTKEENVVLKDAAFAEFNRVFLTYSSEKSERFYGFGEQFSHVDFKGKRVPIFVQEQGIGRGDQPITFAANMVSFRAGGDWSTTYAPSPLYMTSKMRSIYLEGYNYSVFDLTKHDRVQIQMLGDSVEGRILYGNSPAEIIEHLTETIGRPPELPEWIISGAVVGMQGGTDVVRRIWGQLKIYDVPISAFWLQDWVGQRETVIGSQLWWNWQVDSTRYWGWQQLIGDFDAQHIRVMTYCNPCLVPTDRKENTRRKNLFEEAKKLNILVKDEKGEPYMVPNTAFDVGMLDLTHPHTSTWFKQILQDMVDDGVRGWMADFGEGLPVDACLYSGEDPICAHNRYPELWAKINREFADEWRSKQEDPEESLVFFMRAGFRDSPKWAMLFWEGDQMVSWQANDGIKSAVVGLLNGGISGYPLNHSDIGGYCSVNLPFLKYRRGEELLLRWMELNAFTTVFRTHEGNKPSSNIQFYSNNKTLSHFARFAKVYRAWKFYRIQLVKEASEKGLPVCRHLFIHYPDDERVQGLSYHQFLVGTEILVVPVVDKGKNVVKAYFPAGECCSWKHIWTGKLYSTATGCEAWIKAPLGYPAIFIKDGSSIGETFLKNLREESIL